MLVLLEYLLLEYYFFSDSISQGLQTSNALSGSNYLGLQTNSLGFGNSSLGTIGSPSLGNLGAGES